MKNNTGFDLNYIKFRVKLMKGEYYWNAETFFNQTVESHKIIYDGDIASIEIPGMDDYFTGFKINKHEILFDAKLLEILPKPEYHYCKLLEEIKESIDKKR